MKIATTTGDFATGWRDFQYVRSGTEVSQILVMLSDCGFKYIDLNLSPSVYPDSPLCRDDWEKWVDDIACTADRLGLKFVQAHSSDTVYPKGEERDYKTGMIKRQLQVCEKLGIGGMVVHAICTAGGDRADFMEKSAELYHDLLKTAEQTGVMVYTENTCTRNAPSYFLLEAADFHELDAKVGNHPLFGCCWDVGHAHIQGVDQYKEIMAFGKRLRAVHIHDNPGNADIHMQPYAGNCGYDAIVKGLVDSGYEGYFTLESFCLPTPENFYGRKSFEKDGVVYDKLRRLPLEFKLRSERLMLDITRYMLESYNCYEE